MGPQGWMQAFPISAVSEAPTISADGRYVAFHTLNNLIPTDTDNLVDVYVYDHVAALAGMMPLTDLCVT
jgi:hypothetical protein